MNRTLNNILKVIVLITVFTLFTMLITGCAYISGNNNSISVNRTIDLDLDATIAKDSKKEKLK